jgi:hypothetical protein
VVRQGCILRSAQALSHMMHGLAHLNLQGPDSHARQHVNCSLLSPSSSVSAAFLHKLNTEFNSLVVQNFRPKPACRTLCCLVVGSVTQTCSRNQELANPHPSCTVHELPRCMYTRIWSMVPSSEQVGQDMESLNSVAFNGLSSFRVWSHLVEDFDIHSWPGRGRGGHATIFTQQGTRISVHCCACVHSMVMDLC